MTTFGPELGGVNIHFITLDHFSLEYLLVVCMTTVGPELGVSIKMLFMVKM
jgi:hypothetical protein